MTKDGHAVALLSGELSVEQRASVIGRFRRGIEKVLITTNVSARGMCDGMSHILLVYEKVVISRLTVLLCMVVIHIRTETQNLDSCRQSLQW